MIRKVKFSNFYSFQKEQEINFLASKKKTYDYFTSKSEDQITKVAGFIGGNASGKTNVMRLFSFLSYFVCRNVEKENTLVKDIAYKTFFNNEEKSHFYIEFESDDYIFYYDVNIKKNIILQESLSAKKIEKNSRVIKIFSREDHHIVNLDKKYFKNIVVNSIPKIREDVSFIAFVKKMSYSVDIIDKVYNYFLNFKTNINERGEINNDFHQIKTLQTYLQDKELKEEMETFIRNFDIGLSGFKIKKEEKKDGIVVSVRGIHTTNSKNNELDLSYESRGTQSLFFAMANILSALKNSSIIIIDEIESGFHPEALNKLIGYFIDENLDKTAQLIFSSHSLGFMNKLDMHQIFLTEKNNKSESSVLRLNKIKGIRPDENFLSKYMSGVYGAFPKIRV
ncbi:MAG: ATP-binding protein [Candidatus Margulisbacteria bacterium]|nr:ATP-binding protein [Candidatus Margulisiibacteriota bacterium]